MPDIRSEHKFWKRRLAGDVVADYAITVWQVAVLSAGVIVGIRLNRREG